MITAHTPKWANSNHTSIEIIATFPWVSGEVPFSATQNDSEDYGRILFSRAVAGEFGPIDQYVAPLIPVPLSSTSLQFMDRFTEAEQLAIVTATMTIPPVKLWYDRMIAATEIVYKDPRTIGGLQALVSAGLIAQARMNEILPVEWR